MDLIKGTHLDAKFSRMVDGDTIRVFLPGAALDESLRMLALDTEESNAGGSKPVTPWGKEAKNRAEAYFPGGRRRNGRVPGQ
jgi:micrococcal nuclease